MTDQTPQPPGPLPGWTFLAQGEQEHGSISRCPGGHIHLDYDNLTVRFQPDEFLAFARMVAEAMARLQGSPWPAQANLTADKPTTTFSLN